MSHTSVARIRVPYVSPPPSPFSPRQFGRAHLLQGRNRSRSGVASADMITTTVVRFSGYDAAAVHWRIKGRTPQLALPPSAPPPRVTTAALRSLPQRPDAASRWLAATGADVLEYNLFIGTIRDMCTAIPRGSRFRIGKQCARSTTPGTPS